MDMANPFRHPENRPPAPPPAGPRELARMGAMFVVFAFILVAMIGIKLWIDRQKSPPADPGAMPPTREGQGAIASTPADPGNPPAPAQQPLSDDEASARFMGAAGKLKETLETLESPLNRESPEFLDIVQDLRSRVTDDQVARMAQPAHIPDLVQSPDKFRGSVVRISGRLIDLAPNPVTVSTPSGLRVIYDGFIADPGDRHPIQVFIADRPAGELKTINWRDQQFMNETVDVDGVFLRIYRYRGKSTDPEMEGPVRTVPVFVARSMRVRPRAPAPDRRFEIAVIISTACVGVAILILVAGYYSRKYGGRGSSLRMRMAEARGAKLPPPSGDRDILGDEIPPK